MITLVFGLALFFSITLVIWLISYLTDTRSYKRVNPMIAIAIVSAFWMYYYWLVNK